MSRVLKERCISRDGRPAWDLCGVPSERTDFTTCSQGFTLGWYAMPRWGMGPKDNPDAGDARPNMDPTATPMEAMPRWGMGPVTNISHPGLVCDAPLGHKLIVELTMPQSLSNILIHLIWSTRDRRPCLDPSTREKTHAFLAGVVRQCDCEAYRVGGSTDHVHLAIRLSRTVSVADLVKGAKAASSKWLKTQGPEFADFSWQLGYGAFSVGMSQKEALLLYIDNQEEHHRTRSFQDEYRDFLSKYGIAFDERYVWD